MTIYIVHQNDKILMVTDSKELAEKEKKEWREKYKGIGLGNYFWVGEYTLVSKNDY